MFFYSQLVFFFATNIASFFMYIMINNGLFKYFVVHSLDNSLCASDLKGFLCYHVKNGTECESIQAHSFCCKDFDFEWITFAHVNKRQFVYNAFRRKALLYVCFRVNALHVCLVFDAIHSFAHRHWWYLWTSGRYLMKKKKKTQNAKKTEIIRIDTRKNISNRVYI